VARWLIGGIAVLGAWAQTADAGAPGMSVVERGVPNELSRDTLSPCERAGIAAEAAVGLPAGILLAIGRVESGRWDSARGRMTSWPWTINAAGKGQWFDTKDAATQTARSLLDGGTRSIDVGCFQISLLYHPMAFDSLAQAFDPDANARYAARFLIELFGRTGTWEAAVETYHSADPALGFAYRQQVFSTWFATAPVIAGLGPKAQTGPIRTAMARDRDPVANPALIAGVRIWTPMPPGAAATVVAMPGVAMPGSTTPVPNLAISASSLPVISYRMPAGMIPRW
jgi:hypothetical protein